MKELKRDCFQPILKEKIDLENIINYDDLNLELVTSLLNDVISKYVYSTIDLLDLLKKNYKNNLLDAIVSIDNYSKVRFNCCYATMLLKEKLKNNRISSNVISFRSIGFSTLTGDRLIKEAHMALVIPTRRKRKVYYILLDPGLRIPEPIVFFKNKKKVCLKIDHDFITIRRGLDLDYPYSIEIRGYNRYTSFKKRYWCKEYFNVNYETINPLEILFPSSYYLLDGYRMINYPIQKHLFASIKIMTLQKYLECSDYNTVIKISFEELRHIPKKQLVAILKVYTDKLNVDTEELIKTIVFVLNHQEEFVSIIHEEVLKEKIGLISQ